jgi:aconitate hydratase
MSPEFGATATLFPIDDETLAYLRLTGRPPEQVALVERYAKEQGLWREPGRHARVRRAADAGPGVRGALSGGAPPAAGSRRLRDLRTNFRAAYPKGLEKKAGAESRPDASRGRFRELGAPGVAYPTVRVEAAGRSVEIANGSVAIAAITSCTNTSNPTVMVAAGLLARNAVARGLTVPPTVKTSLAPGSRP